MDNMFDRILAEWNKANNIFKNTYWLDSLKKGTAGIAHYKAFLRETYYQAGQNPQLQAFCTAFFPQEKRETMKQFYKHAISELGHDLLALNDLTLLGVDRQLVIEGQPLPETVALTAYGFYQIQFRSPLGYLGYLFHLEFNLTQNNNGKQYMKMLTDKGVPLEALTFLEEHTHIDLGHNELMKRYVKELVKTEEALNEVNYAIRTTCKLHHNMISAAFMAADVELASEGETAKLIKIGAR